MKRNLFFALLSFVPLVIRAQGLINNGAMIVMSGPTANIYIDGATGNYTSQGGGIIVPVGTGSTVTLLGNWYNNSSNGGFSADGTTVVFEGANQTINGTFIPEFDNVVLSGSGTKTLNTITSMCGMSATPVGVLSMGSRPLNLNGFDLTITNPSGTAITNTTGYIISETNAALNPSRVEWLTGTATGSRTIPFGVAGTLIPLTVNITSGMAASSDGFYAATRATASSANTPWASGVTHMFDPTLAQDGSDEAVIDRWWELQFSGNATANITFSYRGSENTLQVPYNTGNLGAQWWATGWFPDNANVGSSPAVLAGVGSVTATGLTFTASTYMPMVLSSLNAPLPVELTSFKGECSGQEILSWATASELNNDYFTVQRSDDGITFGDLGQVNGAGTSTQPHYYTFKDMQPVSGAVYYRLKQTDFNGQTAVSAVITGETCGALDNYMDAYSSGNGIDILMNLNQQSVYEVAVFDARGRIMTSQNFSAAEGANHFLLNGIIPATGVYLVRVTGADGKSFVKRLFIAVE
ncbi:MAG: T9SS type A sorting domain-containing protein [Bacteroidia bacterium]